MRDAREATDLSREWVARRLDPPVSSKTIERWEVAPGKVKRWRLEQLAALYGVTVEALRNGEMAA